MFFWGRVAPQTPEEELTPSAKPGYIRNFRNLNLRISEGNSFSGYERNPFFINLEGKGFANVSGLLGSDFDDDGRAVATADWDHDGDLGPLDHQSDESPNPTFEKQSSTAR
jgi:hypothetical protein